MSTGGRGQTRQGVSAMPCVLAQAQKGLNRRAQPGRGSLGNPPTPRGVRLWEMSLKKTFSASESGVFFYRTWSCCSVPVIIYWLGVLPTCVRFCAMLCVFVSLFV
ncbi:hypothetical protein FKM82_026339 [Ascaphus truei]